MAENSSKEYPSDCILVLGANYDTGNMGVDALLSGTIASIHHARPNTKIIVLDYSRLPRTYEVPTGNSSIEVRLENIRFSWKIWLRNNSFRLLFVALILRIIPAKRLKQIALSAHPVLKTIDRASLAVSLAGGDSFSDIYGFRRLLYVCLPQILCIQVGLPITLLPQTLGPFKNQWAKAMARYIMKRANRVYSRDLSSRKIASDLLGGDANHVSFCHDMAFALESRIPTDGVPSWASNRDRLLVGLNVSGLLLMGGYSRNNMFSLKCDYESLVREIIHLFTLHFDCSVALIPHVGGTEDDSKACSILYESANNDQRDRLHIASSSYGHREMKKIIGQCDFFLGSRMHATIAALSQGVPAVGLAYSRKFEGVFESIGVEELAIDLRSRTQEEILGQIRLCFENREEYRVRLCDTASMAKEGALNLFGVILDRTVASHN